MSPPPPPVVRSILAALLLRLFASGLRGPPAPQLPPRPPRSPTRPPSTPPSSERVAAAAAATASMAPWERYHLDPPPPGGTPRSQRVLNWCLLVLAPAGMAWEWKTGNLRVPGGGAEGGAREVMCS
ncbi:hypothetical protein I4F81_001903 [Pyropia yezoensis]|uniref:Uncharacterized protein n=1 Tax=Pyropia yezoensis TaxID=2788 RepID=A0ACC3BMV9_PYRYE|nr:hypothetical protein I4F81_001903 [Neopyropia yezoensis]